MAKDAAELLEGVTADGMRRVFCVLCRLAHCDGEVAAAERQVLHSYGEWFGLTDEELHELEEFGKATDALRIGKTREERDLLLCAMIDVASADGKLAKEEMDRILKIGEVVGMPREQMLAQLTESVQQQSEFPDVGPDALRRIYVVLCRLSLSDGNVDPREQKTLESYRERFSISPAEAKKLEIEARTQDGMKIGKNPSERSLLIQAMLEVAAADGVVDKAEEERLLRIGTVVGLKDEVVATIQAKRGKPPAPKPAASAPRAVAPSSPRVPPKPERQAPDRTLTDSGEDLKSRDGGDSAFVLRTVDTVHGPVKFHFLPGKSVADIQKHWTLGLEAVTQGNARFKIKVVQPTGELHGAKLVQGEAALADARGTQTVTRMRLGHGLGQYVAAGFTGVLIAGTYVHPVGPGKFEYGVLLLAAPGQHRKDRETRPAAGFGFAVPPREGIELDRNLGPGSGSMIGMLLEKIGRGDADPSLPLMAAFSKLEVRPKLDPRGLSLDFLVAARQVFCLAPNLSDDDPSWAGVAKGGLKHLLHMPTAVG